MSEDDVCDASVPKLDADALSTGPADGTTYMDGATTLVTLPPPAATMRPEPSTCDGFGSRGIAVLKVEVDENERNANDPPLPVVLLCRVGNGQAQFGGAERRRTRRHAHTFTNLTGHPSSLRPDPPTTTRREGENEEHNTTTMAMPYQRIIAHSSLRPGVKINHLQSRNVRAI